jgi:hypothetical protein
VSENGAYAAMVEAGVEALAPAWVATQAELEADVRTVLDAVLPLVGDVLDAYVGTVYDRNADWRDGVDECAEYLRRLAASGDRGEFRG